MTDGDMKTYLERIILVAFYLGFFFLSLVFLYLRHKQCMWPLSIYILVVYFEGNGLLNF